MNKSEQQDVALREQLNVLDSIGKADWARQNPEVKRLLSELRQQCEKYYSTTEDEGLAITSIDSKKVTAEDEGSKQFPEKTIEQGRVLTSREVRDMLDSADRVTKIRLRGLFAIISDIEGVGPENWFPENDAYGPEGISKQLSAARDAQAGPDEIATWESVYEIALRARINNNGPEKSEREYVINTDKMPVVNPRQVTGNLATLLSDYTGDNFKTRILQPDALDTDPDNTDGTYKVVGKTEEGDVVAIPAVPRFQSRQDFSHFASTYEVLDGNPVAGDILVIWPAIFTKDGKLKQRGQLKNP